MLESDASASERDMKSDFGQKMMSQCRVPWASCKKVRQPVRTMMKEIETSVYPDAIVEDGLVLLGVDRPFTWFGDYVVHDIAIGTRRKDERRN